MLIQVNYLDKFKETVESKGVCAALKKSIKYLCRKVISIRTVHIIEFEISKKKEPDKKLDILFKWALPTDIESMDKINYDYDDSAKKYSIMRLNEGDRCILALCEGKIVGYIWLMKTKMEILDNTLMDISDEKAYIYRVFVHSDYRGNRILERMEAYGMAVLEKEGKKIAIEIVGKDKKESLKSHRRTGWKIVGNILQVSCLICRYKYINHKTKEYLQNIQ